MLGLQRVEKPFPPRHGKTINDSVKEEMKKTGHYVVFTLLISTNFKTFCTGIPSNYANPPCQSNRELFIRRPQNSSCQATSRWRSRALCPFIWRPRVASWIMMTIKMIDLRNGRDFKIE